MYVRAGGDGLKIVPEGDQVGRLGAKVELPPCGSGVGGVNMVLVWCGVVWCVVWCGVVWCGVVWWREEGGGGWRVGVEEVEEWRCL